MSIAVNEKLQEIFRAVFEFPPNVDVTDVDQMAEEKWDSLAHVSLVAAIESEFGITIDVGDALRLTSFRTAMVLLEEKGF